MKINEGSNWKESKVFLEIAFTFYGKLLSWIDYAWVRPDEFSANLGHSI